MSQSTNAKRRLHGKQEPRIRICPNYDYTYGEDAATLAKSYGLDPDPWQRMILNDWLGRIGDDMYAADTCGVSVPRQNGKNGVLEGRELYGISVEGEKILHTAHEVKTARKAFLRLVSFFENEREYPELVELVKDIRKANGQEAIILNNGGSIEFSARSRGAARGFTVDVVVCDEAQELTDEQLEALLPTSSAGPLGNSQLILLGTPPGPGSAGTVFKRTRHNALSGGSEGICWHEWSVDSIGDVKDESRWEETNPALGIRLQRKSIEKELATMSADGFARERLGWWQEGSVDAIFSRGEWEALATDSPPADGKTAYGIKFSVDGSSVALAVALISDEETPYVEVIEHRSMSSGSAWLADFVEHAWKTATAVVIDGKAGAQNLIDELRRRGVGKRVIVAPSAADVITAASGFISDVHEEKVAHYNQPALNDSVLNAQRRAIGTAGGFAFKGYNGADMSPLEACSLALWGAKTSKRDPSRKLRIG